MRPGRRHLAAHGTFRGITNIGDDSGFLWAVLGGDDPGQVLWAPQVFDLAADHGWSCSRPDG